MRIGIVSAGAADPSAGIEELVAEAQIAEADGFQFLSVPNIFGVDAITALAIAGRETNQIELATGVVPSPPRHPLALAQQALTAQAAAGGRFVLGIGLSHKLVIEDMMGLTYAKPAKQMREYLEVLMPLMRGEPTNFEGDLYQVKGSISVAGASTVPVIVAALGPKMLEVAGTLADGTATWMTGRRTLAELTVPTIGKAAEAAGRPAPRVITALPLALTGDAAGARETAGKIFAMYGTLPSYRAMLDREGADGPGDVALTGDEASLREQIQQLRDAGVTDFAASLFEAEAGCVQRTREFLASEI
ncbi:MAG: TIGR03564 family F420-dependent LLM class oxidoreductase [Myxococcota bacterium]|nr:TIGR03564 family F420-dependent LLM class oxidoreductase [Myxococcota bacterium]